MLELIVKGRKYIEAAEKATIPGLYLVYLRKARDCFREARRDDLAGYCDELLIGVKVDETYVVQP